MACFATELRIYLSSRVLVIMSLTMQSIGMMLGVLICPKYKHCTQLDATNGLLLAEQSRVLSQTV